MLVQVTAPHFCAGLVIENGVCTVAAPILKRSIGRSADELRAYFKWKGWKAIQVKEHETTPPGAKDRK